ncbi:Ubiquitin carboxyl-terminal hydrolase [Phytophthora boehmeriae]|uniref:Ubiquitin carboxyl-terminal hydrolase n=1 Tax=Phytophthora boehmeriae TaxID=109152 RepID=A0A8T1X7X7_9STRA|nr:Ubiquitin carboxyl-terminal hydrolase [Phytophthora boehmeriae]
MPYVNIASNVARADVDTSAAIVAVTQTVAAALDRPAPHVVVQMELDLLMSHQESQAPVAFIHVRSIGRIDDERNPKTVKALTETVAEHLSVSPTRVNIYLEDISAKHWANNGKIVG